MRKSGTDREEHRDWVGRTWDGGLMGVATTVWDSLMGGTQRDNKVDL